MTQTMNMDELYGQMWFDLAFNMLGKCYTETLE